MDMPRAELLSSRGISPLTGVLRQKTQNGERTSIVKESIHQYFKVGTLLWMSCPAEDPLTALKKIVCDDYFDAVELSHMEDPAVREHARKMTEEGLMYVGYGAHPTILGRKLNPNALDEETRLSAEKALLSVGIIRGGVTHDGI